MWASEQVREALATYCIEDDAALARIQSRTSFSGIWGGDWMAPDICTSLLGNILTYKIVEP